MFRKKRKKNLETSPLQSYEVGHIKENKFWFIKLILFFGFFMAIIFFLPDITTFVNEYIKGTAVGGNTKTNTTTNNTTNNTVNEIVVDETKNYFNEEKETTVNNIVFSAVKLDQNKITFNAKNNLTDKVDLEQLNIYFEVYNETDNLLKRIAILGDILAGETRQFSFNFTGEAKYYEIKEILEEDYTYIDLSIDDNNVSTLTCTKDTEKIVYTFNNEKLTRINHTDNVEKTSSSYDKKYTSYNDLYVKNRTNTGITASFKVEDDILSYKMQIDYTKAASKIDNRLYFAKDTLPRIVNFKVESWEYECR